MQQFVHRASSAYVQEWSAGDLENFAVGARDLSIAKLATATPSPFHPIAFVIDIGSCLPRLAVIRESPGALFALFVKQSPTFRCTDAQSGQKSGLAPSIQLLSTNTSLPSTNRCTSTGCCGLDLLCTSGCHSKVPRVRPSHADAPVH